jgi:hypothetical protein
VEGWCGGENKRMKCYSYIKYSPSEDSMAGPQKLSMQFPFDSAILSLVTHSKNKKRRLNRCLTSVYIAALVTIAKRGNTNVHQQDNGKSTHGIHMPWNAIQP